MTRTMKSEIVLRCISRLCQNLSWLKCTSKKVNSYSQFHSFSRINIWLLESVFSLSALEAQLVAYVKNGEAFAQPFDTSSIPKISRQQLAQESARPSTLDTIAAPSSKAQASAAAAAQLAARSRAARERHADADPALRQRERRIGAGAGQRRRPCRLHLPCP